MTDRDEPFELRERIRELGDDAEVAALALYHQAGARLIAIREQHAHWGMEVLDRWKAPLDGLELIVHSAEEIADEFDSRYLPEVSESSNHRAQVLREMVRDGVLVGLEVVLLLRHGYPGGAFARWRSLHEMDAVARIVREGDERAALGFREHEVLRERRLVVDAHRLQKRFPAVGTPGAETVRRCQREIDAMKATHEPEFFGDFGWAHPTLTKHADYERRWKRGERPRGPLIGDLRVAAQLEIFGYDYAVASFSVHASSKMRQIYAPELSESFITTPIDLAIDGAGISAAFAMADLAGELVKCHPPNVDEDLWLASEVVRILAAMVTEDFLQISGRSLDEA